MGANASDDVFGWADRDPARVVFATQAGGAWQPVTAEQLARRVGAVAAGLAANGIRPADRVGLMAATSLDWAVCDFAIWAAGAVTVPIYETSPADQIGWQLGDSGAVAVFAGTAGIAEAVRRAKPETVKAMWRLDAGDLDALASSGQAVAFEEVAHRRSGVTAGTLATIVYTSGTTGRPKGCMINHGNLTEAVRAILAAPGVQDPILAGDASVLLFLPLAHVLARAVLLCLVHAGKRVGFLPDPGELPRALRTFRPTILLAVPRVLEKVAESARQQAEEGGHRRLFAAAEATAIAWSRSGRPGLPLRLRHAVFDRLVYARLRQGLGGQVRWVISGAAPLGQDLAHFLRGAGVTVLEGWGLTEAVGPHTMNRPAEQRIGSVGLPMPGYAVRIAPNGELEVEGPDVFQGYWHDPQATAEAFDGRWLRTGDLGRIDADGFVYVTGRRKEILITAGGQHVVPSALEDKVRQNWLIAECVVVGDRRPYPAALLTLDEGAFAQWKHQHRKPAGAAIADLSDDPDLRKAVQHAVDSANATVSRPETIKRFRILPGQFEEGAELTPSGKVRRSYIMARYASDIDALYA
jgi:long-chain acyl-CoA synthetase